MIQTAFIVITKPISNAGQLKFSTTLGAATNMATVNAIFTASQKKNPNIAAPALTEVNLLVNPRANTALGTITDRAPNAADEPALDFPVTNQVITATTAPTKPCTAKTRQGEIGGFCFLSAWASWAVSGLKTSSLGSYTG